MTAWNAAETPGDLTFSNSDLTVEKAAGATSYRWVRSLVGHNSGKKYFQVRLDAVTNTGECAAIGLANSSANLTSYVGTDVPSETGIGYYADGNVWFSGSELKVIGAISASEWARCAVDFDAGKAWFGDASAWDGDPAAGTDPTWTFTPGTTLYAGFTLYTAGDKITANFGGSAFNDAAPSGFSAWSSGQAARTAAINAMRRSA
jgi:hypothetical protein